MFCRHGLLILIRYSATSSFSQEERLATTVQAIVARLHTGKLDVGILPGVIMMSHGSHHMGRATMWM